MGNNMPIYGSCSNINDFSQLVCIVNGLTIGVLFKLKLNNPSFNIHVYE